MEKDMFKMNKHFKIEVSDCTPLFQKESNGKYYSVFTMTNQGKTKVVYRIKPNTAFDNNQYKISPSYGVLPRYSKIDIVISTRTPGRIPPREELALDCFEIDFVRIKFDLHFPQTAEWYFNQLDLDEVEVYNVVTRFVHPYYISSISMHNLIKGLNTESTQRITQSMKSGKLELLAEEDVEFVGKAFRFFYKKEKIESMDWKSLLTPMIAWVILAILGAVAAIWGCNQALTFLTQ